MIYQIEIEMRRYYDICISFDWNKQSKKKKAEVITIFNWLIFGLI